MTDAGAIPASAEPRVDWVDVAKGVCIVLVVMMHSTLGVGIAMNGEGFMHHVVAFSKPFRMPDFFLISGLFLALVVDRPWRRYLDRKVVHFLYFYLLWLLIQGAFKWPGLALEDGIGAVAHAFLISLIDPFGTLWFIYLLPIFFVFAKLVKSVHPLLVLAFAAVLETLRVQTGWMVPDEFCARLFYVMLGWYSARYVFAAADLARDHRALAVAALAAWALANGAAVAFGYSERPGVSLLLGSAGALAIVAASALVAGTTLGEPLRYAGERSLAVYLAFFLPMAATRVILVKTGVIPDVGWVSLIVTIAGVTVPLALHWLVTRTGKGRFLFERPAAFRIDGARAAGPKLQPAE
ncbi:acyltransferase family protein [Chenggangzhangella methanolivorans]|uniref:Acyltransferase family protein n=1 Tax=Chenggangzhangella methanolivorans TaxID=1437009 RepID=A0A9E6RHH8_9HYPH|nr:acyltransferase family protein [Chenggangzhangella methanolivorans]QZO01536.1 acyltransferase family protein [Chenggangzhangella methanolivorans]